MAADNYRKFKIKRWEGVQVGYAPMRHNKTEHTITHRSRKIKGYLLHYPDNESTHFVYTLHEASEYIDRYYEEIPHEQLD